MHDVASQAFPFSACNIEKWVWPGDEATIASNVACIEITSRMWVIYNTKDLLKFDNVRMDWRRRQGLIQRSLLVLVLGM